MEAAQIHKVIQGTPEWLALRAQPNTYTASEAPAMMGASKHMTRNELVKQKATGVVPEVNHVMQAIFDSGHAAEAKARPIAEAVFGEELYPVTMTRMVNGLILLASLDGADIAVERIWENKLFNAELAAAILACDLDPHYYWQLEQELLVSGANEVYLTTSDGTVENTHGCWYTSRPERRTQLILGWLQFAKDCENYQHVEVLPPVVATPTQDLPALMVRVDGSISLVSNLDKFGQMLRKFVDAIDKNPSTDQAFADCESAVKKLEKAEDALRSAEADALAQTASIDDMRKAIAMQIELASTTRLSLKKIVKARKETIRIEIVDGGKKKLAEEIAMLNKLIGFNYMPVVAADFTGAIKGKRTVESVRNAVDTELARAKIEAQEIYSRIQFNLNEPAVAEFDFLFADIATLCLKPADDFKAVVALRVADHRTKEEARLESERAAIRAEEAAKLAREAEAEAEAAAQRIRDDQFKLATQAPQEATGQTAQAACNAEVRSMPDGASIVVSTVRQQAAVTPVAPMVSVARRSPRPVPRPTDAAIIDTLSQFFRVHESKVIEWLLDMDLKKASADLLTEFNA